MNEKSEINHEDERARAEKKQQLQAALKDTIAQTQTVPGREFYRFRSVNSKSLARELLNATSDKPMFNNLGVQLNNAPDNANMQMNDLAAQIEEQRESLDYRVVLLLSKYLPKHFTISRRYQVFLEKGVIPPERMDQYHDFAAKVAEIDAEIKAEKELS